MAFLQRAAESTSASGLLTATEDRELSEGTQVQFIFGSTSSLNLCEDSS